MVSTSSSAPLKCCTASCSSSSSDRKKKVSFEVKKKAQDANSLQSSSTGSENSGSKTIYMPIKQEANGQTAEAIVVEDKEEKADLDLQNVKLVVKAEKENEKIFWSMI